VYIADIADEGVVALCCLWRLGSIREIAHIGAGAVAEGRRPIDMFDNAMDTVHV